MEVLIVIAIIAAVAVMTMPILSSSMSRNELDVAVEGAVDALEEARSSALNGKDSGRFGVHFEVDKYVLFGGASYVEGDADNFIHQLPGLVSITSISISGGGADILFSSVSGVPDQTGSIEFTDSSGEIKTVTVNAAGTVDF